MKYRSKLYLSFMLVVLFTNGLFLGINYWETQEEIHTEVGAIGLSIAATTAGMIDGDRYQQLDKTTSESSPLYQELEQKLRHIRDINRRKDVYVKYIYSLIPDKARPDMVRFGVDAEEPGHDKTHIGTVLKLKAKKNLKMRYDVSAVLPDFIEDSWGTWLTANHPIYNKEGKVVGSIRVDISADDVFDKFRAMLIINALILLAMVAFGAMVSGILARRFSKPLATIRDALLTIGQGNLEHKIQINSKDEFAEVADAINEMTAGLKQRDMLRTSLTRYVSKGLAERILQNEELPKLYSERKKVTILVCDIRNFTPLAERLKPEEVVSLLNEFFGEMIEAVSSHHGILDKYLGDGFLAIFGSLTDDPYQEDHALQAAIAMRHIISRLSLMWKSRFGIDLSVGIGINSGNAIVGNIGAQTHMEYTAIGDTVNLASRIESATKRLAQDILVSEYTYISASRNQFQFTPLGEIAVKGRMDKVKVYAVNEKI